jgi:hypothetical protein
LRDASCSHRVGSTVSSDFLDVAIEAHTKWKIRLLTAVNGGEVPDRATVSVDHRCDLGRWIYGEGGATYAPIPEFGVLRDAHKRFHTSLGGVLDLLASGKKDAAKDNIMTGEYARASQEVVRAIGSLKRKVTT